MTNRISSTPDYSSCYHNGELYVRLDQTDPQTGAVRSLLIIPDRLSPTDRAGYVDFMIKKAEKDQEEIRQDVRKAAVDLKTISEEVKEIRKERREIREEREEILEGVRQNLKERGELAREFVKLVHDVDRLCEQASKSPFDLLHASQNTNNQGRFFDPILNACSSALEGIKSFFFRSGTK